MKVALHLAKTTKEWEEGCIPDDESGPEIEDDPRIGTATELIHRGNEKEE